jgi:hypothetical protein
MRKVDMTDEAFASLERRYRVDHRRIASFNYSETRVVGPKALVVNHPAAILTRLKAFRLAFELARQNEQRSL